MLSFARSPEFSLLSQLVAKPPGNSESSVEELADIARARAVGTNEVVHDLKKLKVAPNASLGDLGILAAKLSQLEEIKPKLDSARVRAILGSDGSLWMDRIPHLHATLELVSALARVNPPQVFWTKLNDEPLSGLIRSLASQHASLSEAVKDIHRCQDRVSSRARLEYQTWIDNHDLDGSPIQKIRKRIDYALSNRDALQPYLDFLKVELIAKASPLVSVLGPLQDAAGDYALLPEAFDFIFYRSCAEKLLGEDSRLCSHSGATHEQLRKRYQQLDRKIMDLRREQIASGLTDRRIEPGVGRGRASDFTDLALVRRQIGLQRRHLALRELFRRAGNAIQTLKPCFMMSPMSVAQFLEPDGIRFDLVVMDEASQIRPEDALGALARGTQVVVVGDPMQLPPTSFFEKVDRDESADEDSEEAEVQDLTGQESILDLARGPYQPVRQLRWHYRSRHESLIAFSNREFYDNSLIVFPSPHDDNPQFGVRIVEVDGVYESSQNRREAEAVVAAAQTFMHDFPSQSLGIVAMNKIQQDLLQKLMDDLFASDVKAEAYRLHWEDTLESTFVKNLENVQGDERDVIFISTVYGKDAAGNFYQRLGPINGVHGHRRLNVLFTRAKHQVRLFTSMKSSDLRIEAKTRWGVKALKNYLSFAKDGHFEVGDVTAREPDSEFERWVIQMLREAGYEVVPQVGVAGYFIDLAVRHPDRTGAFILGVECDGAMYHSARSVRDRDRLRQEILERLNWNIYRIWSTDWFRNPRVEFKKLVDRIEELRLDKK